MDDNIEISALTAAQTGVSFARNTELTAGVDARTDIDLETFLLSDSALTGAFAAGFFDDLTGSVAGGAVLTDAEKSLRDGLRACAAAAGAGFLACSGSAA